MDNWRMFTTEKRLPLVKVLLKTAAEQGATVVGFQQACEDACMYLKAKSLRLHASELLSASDAGGDEV